MQRMRRAHADHIQMLLAAHLLYIGVRFYTVAGGERLSPVPVCIAHRRKRAVGQVGIRFRVEIAHFSAADDSCFQLFHALSPYFI